ncbi:MAG TPA: trypsin-like peptidase domain-containing protein, partial [Gemmatimonadaceae bacterium]|nr:trypsin-like peptidase domain-containing protein [Gemmatimonadaceae bacterium]
MAALGVAALGAAAPAALAVAQQPPVESAVVRPMIEAENAFMAVAEQVTPSVVAIRVARRAPGAAGLQGRVAEGSGSGFIVSPDGYILTNNHVVAGARVVTVTLLDKRELEARVVGTDPSTDVALIKVQGERLPAVAFGDDARLRVGQWVLAIGNPLGLDFTVTAGIVSAKGRSVPGLLQSSFAITDFIQTDAAINPGNSGGPLVNIRGEVVGMNSAILSPTGVNAGAGFAIPISLARDVMEDLIEYGEVRRAVLGIALNEVTADVAERLGLPAIAGALVTGFPAESSPAYRAGLRPGDVIVGLDGRPVDRVTTLQRIIRDREPGAVVAVEFLRGGARRTAQVRLAAA